MLKNLYPRRGALLASLLLCSAAPVGASAQDGSGAPPPAGYPPQGFPPQGYGPQGYAPQGYAPPAYPPASYPPQGYAAQAAAPPGYAQQGYPSEAYAPQGYAPRGYAPQAYTPQAYTPQAYTPQASAPQAYASQGYASQGYASQGYAPQAYAPQGYAPRGYAPQAYGPQGYPAEAYGRQAYPPPAPSRPYPPQYAPQGNAPQGYGQPGYAPQPYAPGAPSAQNGAPPIGPANVAAPDQDSGPTSAAAEGELRQSGYASAPGGKGGADAGNPYAPGAADRSGPEADAAPAAASAAEPGPAAPASRTTASASPSAEGPSLSPRIVSAASAYLGFMRRASDITPAFSDGGGVARSVRIGAAYEPKQFQEGVIAYTAMVAMKDPAFIAGVQGAWAGDPRRADAIAADLAGHPEAVLQIPGAQSAAARAAGAIRRQGERLLQAGLRVKQAAYDVQHASWSKGDVAEPEARLAGAKRLSATPLEPSPEETTKLLNLVLAEETGADAAGAGATPLLSRGLALAALSLMGETEENSEGRLAALLTEAKGGECLKMAKLNLFQCLAVAGPHYEDIFCLGQHALMDTAQCVISALGGVRTVSTASVTPAANRSFTPLPGDGPGAR